MNIDIQRSPGRPTHAVAVDDPPLQGIILQKTNKLFMELIHIKRALPAIVAAGALFSLFEE